MTKLYTIIEKYQSPPVCPCLYMISLSKENLQKKKMAAELAMPESAHEMIVGKLVNLLENEILLADVIQMRIVLF